MTTMMVGGFDAGAGTLSAVQLASCTRVKNCGGTHSLSGRWRWGEIPWHSQQHCGSSLRLVFFVFFFFFLWFAPRFLSFFVPFFFRSFWLLFADCFENHQACFNSCLIKLSQSLTFLSLTHSFTHSLPAHSLLLFYSRAPASCSAMAAAAVRQRPLLLSALVFGAAVSAAAAAAASPLWSVTDTSGSSSIYLVAVPPDDAYVAFGTSNGGVTALDLGNGATAWSFTTTGSGGGVDERGCASLSTLFTGGDNDRCVRIFSKQSLLGR